MRLYIDDIRNPQTDNWIIKRSSAEVIEFFERYKCPNYISFDHDLGGDDTAMVIIKYMVNRDLDENGNFIPGNFEFNVHSANPVGAANIKGYLNAYFAQKNRN